MSGIFGSSHTDETGNDFGTNSFQLKMQKIEEAGDNSISMEDFNDIGTVIAKVLIEDIPNAAKSVAGNIADVMLPGFVQRMKKKRIYAKTIEEVEKKPDQLADKTAATIVKDLEHKKFERATNRMIKELLNAKKHLREEVRKVLDDNEKKQSLEEIEDYKRRRELQIAEINAKREKEKTEKQEELERQTVSRRLWSINFFNEKAQELRDESIMNRANIRNRQAQERQDALDQVVNEWEVRDDARSRLQVELPSLTGPIVFPGGEQLGIFEMPPKYDTQNFLEGVDQHDIHVLSSSPHTEYEEREVEHIDTESTILQYQSLYDSVQHESVMLDESIEKMCVMRDVLERDQLQVNQELLSIEKDQLGPPRRLAVHHEMQSVDVWKQRSAQIQKKLQDLQYTVDKADRRKKVADAQCLDLAHKLAILREKRKKDMQSQETLSVGALPMVIGRSISKAPGLGGAFAKPKEAFDAITHQSRLIAMKEQGAAAAKIHNERSELDQQLWVNRQDGAENIYEYESLLNRLSDFSKRLHKVGLDNARLNLVDGLNAFFARKLKLNPLKSKLVGILPWYIHHDPLISQNTTRYITNNAMGAITFESVKPTVTSSEDDSTSTTSPIATSSSSTEPTTYSSGITLSSEKHGHCSGVINLPKDTLWSLLVTVTKQGTGEVFENLDPTDSVTVKIGPTFSGLSTIGIFYNRINPVTGTVLYDVKHLYKGASFAFRFEFSSSTTDVRKHLAVCTGIYEEYEMQAMETVDDPISGKSRVLSSFVKMVRIDEQSGKFKETRLLEELADIESSTKDYWDSKILNNYSQRYGKEYFLRILRAEILVQQDTAIALAAIVAKRKEEQAFETKVIMAGANLDKEAKLEMSMKRYITKKRLAQKHLLDEAEDLVSKRLVVWDAVHHIWRNISVLSCNVKWVESGLVARITHRVQEYDEGNDKVGGEMEVDLKSFKYFLSPVQVFDRETMLRWKERKEFNLKVTAIGVKANSDVERLQRSLDKYKKQLQKMFEERKTKRMAFFESTAEETARNKSNANTAAMKRALKALLQDIVIDVRKGIVILDEKSKESKNEQLKKLAKERFASNWVVNQRKQLEVKFAEEAVELNDQLHQRQDEVQRLIQKIRAKADRDITELSDVMRAKTKKRKKHLLTKVKFDPAIFKKAAPLAANCEHLKTKAWGDKYSKGIKCLICGKELSQLEKEESQVLGYGSGADPWLVDAVRRHRDNEASFRFTKAEEITRVEEERRRLEKERREMEEQEGYFYDFQDLKIVYEFDQRHAKTIKRAGIFRQGLQWTEEELVAYGEARQSERKLQLLAEGRSEVVATDFDPLRSIQDPPPTYRAVDERHHSQYNELVFSIGRLKTFSKRIDEFRMARFEPVEARKLYSAILESLYKDANHLEGELDMLERDLDKTSKLLSTLARMQILMDQSNKIRAQAVKDKKKAEMKQCGVWDNVQECRDKTSTAHDETRTLLRSKILMDRKLEEEKKLIAFRVVNLEAAKLKHQESERVAIALKYCMPGNLVMTKFGECIISSYRPKDDVLLVLLPFGNPPAKAYLYYKEVVDLERSKANAEALLMELEDEYMKGIMTEEKIMLKKENYLMRRAEEGLKEIYNFIDMSKRETIEIKDSITASVEESYLVTESNMYNRLQSTAVKRLVTKEKADRERKRKEYIGPKAGRPAKMTVWEVHRAKKAIVIELNTKFIFKAATKTEVAVKQKLYAERSAWVEAKTVESLISFELSLLVEQIAAEAISEGRAAKGFAEKKSGVIFPNPVWMQYGTYDSLATIWKAKKEDLRHNIEVSKGETAKLLASNASPMLLRKRKQQQKSKMTLAELHRLKAEKRARKLEKFRQERLCNEMLREEIACKDFYRWELNMNLRERRLMKDEEALSRQVRKEEIQKRIEMEAFFGAGGGSASGGAGDISDVEQRGKSYERRRQELKDLTIERRRRTEDQAYMIVEDKLGVILREIDKAERQRKAFLEQFGTLEGESASAPIAFIDPNSGGLDVNEPIDEEDREVVEIINGQPVFKVPDWLLPNLPLSFYEWGVKKQNKYIRLMTQIRIKTKKISRNAEREHKRLEKLSDKSYKEWADLYRVVELEEMESELAVMEAEEELRETEAKLEDYTENSNRIQLFCREKGEEELKLRTELKKLEEIARKRDRELMEADAWLNLCINRSKNRDKLKRKVNESCKWVDTESVNGFYQRFATELLRERLYLTYFRQIVESMVTRAEIIASERKIMKLQEELTINKVKLLDRIQAKQFLMNDIRRDEFLRMRRSLLNEKFFPRNRRAVLMERFSGWIRYFLWNRGHKEAFELKYELIKRQLDIDRQFKEQLKSSQSPPKEKSKTTDKNKKFQTLMQRHRERTVQCKNCSKLYIESQNNSIICEYHPKSYTLACPKTCPNPGLTSLCSSHRMRRWPCCDNVRQECVGCCRRSHCPPDSDPVYDSVMNSINERDKDFMESLDEKIAYVQSNDFPTQLNAAKKNKIFEIEDKLAMNRATAERFKNLKFV